MIELLTWFFKLTIAEFTELCASSIGMIIFISCCSAFIVFYLFYDFIDDFIVIMQIRKEERKKEKQDN